MEEDTPSDFFSVSLYLTGGLDLTSTHNIALHYPSMTSTSSTMPTCIDAGASSSTVATLNKAIGGGADLRDPITHLRERT